MATIAEPERTVYLETTIVSYLTARPSRDVVILGHQELTRQWWQEERESYRLVVSPVVLAEAKRGDPEAAEKRLRALSGIEILDPVPEVGGLAREVQSAMNIPEDFSPDAFHVGKSGAALAILPAERPLAPCCVHPARNTEGKKGRSR